MSTPLGGAWPSISKKASSKFVAGKSREWLAAVRGVRVKQCLSMMMVGKASLAAAFLAACGFCVPALSDTAATVDTTNALLARSSGATSSVTRLGYYALGDVAPLTYVSSGSTCPKYASVTASLTNGSELMTVTAVTMGSVPLNGIVVQTNPPPGIPLGTRVVSVPAGAGNGTYRLSQPATTTGGNIAVIVSGDGGSQIPSSDNKCFLAYSPGSSGVPPATNTVPAGTADPAEFGAVADFNATTVGDIQAINSTGSTYNPSSGLVTLKLASPLTIIGQSITLKGVFGPGSSTNLNGDWSNASESINKITFTGPTGLGGVTISGGYVSSGGVSIAAGSNQATMTTSSISTAQIGDGITIPWAGPNYTMFSSTITNVTSSGNVTTVTMADAASSTVGYSGSNTSGVAVRVTWGSDNNAPINAALNTGLNTRLGSGRYYFTGTLSVLNSGQHFNGASTDQGGDGTDLEPAGDAVSPAVLLAQGQGQEFGNFYLTLNNRIGTLNSDDGVGIQSYGHTGTNMHDLSTSQGFRPFLLDSNNSETLRTILNQNITGDYGIKVFATVIPGETISSMNWSSGQITVVCSAYCIAGGVGDFVKITGATNSGTGGSAAINTTFQVTSRTDNKHFVLNAPDPAGGVFGTITGGTMANDGGYQILKGDGNINSGAGTSSIYTYGGSTTLPIGTTSIPLADTGDLFPGMIVADITPNRPAAFTSPTYVQSIVPNASVTLVGTTGTIGTITTGDQLEFYPNVKSFWGSSDANSLEFSSLHSQGGCGSVTFYDPTSDSASPLYIPPNDPNGQFPRPTNEFTAFGAGGDNQYCGSLNDVDGINIKIAHLYVNVRTSKQGNVSGPGVYMGPLANTLYLNEPHIDGTWNACLEIAGANFHMTDPEIGQCSDSSGEAFSSGYAAVQFDSTLSGQNTISGGTIGQINTTLGGGRYCLSTSTTDPTLIVVQGVQCQTNLLGAYDDPTNYTLGVNGDGTNPSNTPQSAPALNPWTRYLFRNLNNSYTTAHIALIDATYKALLSNGLFAKADMLYFATGSLGDSLINWRYPGTGQVKAFKPTGKVINFAEIGSVTAHVGGLIAGNASSYIDTGFPMSAALHCQTTSCSLFVYSTTVPGSTSTTPDIVSLSNSATSITARDGGGSLQFTPNSITTYTNTVTNTAGLFGWVLSGTTANAYQGSSVLLPAHTMVPPFTLASGDLGLLGNGTNANTVRQDAFFGVFDGTLTGTDVSNLSMIVSNFVNSW